MVLFADSERFHTEYLGKLVQKCIRKPGSLNIALEDSDYRSLPFAFLSAALKVLKTILTSVGPLAVSKGVTITKAAEELQ